MGNFKISLLVSIEVPVQKYFSGPQNYKVQVLRAQGLGSTRRHRPLSSSILGLPYRILSINHKKELLRGLWVGLDGV